MKYWPYSKYKDSGIEWLGDIPEHWNLVNLSGIFSENKLKNKDLAENNLLSLSYGRIKRKDIETNDGLLPESFDGYQIVEEGFIILRFTDLQNDKKSLRTGYVEERGIITSAYIGLVNKSKTQNTRFYQLFLHAFDIHKGFYGMGSGIRQSLSYEELKKFKFAIPPYEEQTTITDFLNRETTRIDSLIKEKENFIGLLKEKRLATVEHIIHQKGTVDIRLGMVINKIFRPVERVANEEYIALGVYNKGRGVFQKPPKKEDELGNSDFFWIQEGDLILSGQFAWEGSVALASENENNCIVSHRYPVIKGKNDILNTEYLWAFFTTQKGDYLLNNHSVGSAGRNRPLNINTLLKEKIPVPTMEAQMEVARIVEAENKIKIETENSIELLKEHRTALISAAVTGKIDVRHLAKEAA